MATPGPAAVSMARRGALLWTHRPADAPLPHWKTDSLRKPRFRPRGLHLQMLPWDTSWVWFISHELLSRRELSYPAYNPEQLTLTSSRPWNKKTQALLTFHCGRSYLQAASVILSLVRDGRQIKILTQCHGVL